MSQLMNKPDEAATNSVSKDQLVTRHVKGETLHTRNLFCGIVNTNQVTVNGESYFSVNLSPIFNNSEVLFIDAFNVEDLILYNSSYVSDGELVYLDLNMSVLVTDPFAGLLCVLPEEIITTNDFTASTQLQGVSQTQTSIAIADTWEDNNVLFEIIMLTGDPVVNINMKIVYPLAPPEV